jgi:hypothetical protein
MSLFNRRRKTDDGPAAQASAPANWGPGAPAAPRANRTIDPVAYGLVPAAQIRADRAGPSPDPDTVATLVAAQDWQGMSTFLAGLPETSDRRFAALGGLGNAAANDDTWLRRWLAAEPTSVNALSIYAESLVSLAWQIRTSDRAENVTREQWNGFFRVLKGIPDVCGRAIEIDPADPAPWIALMNGALGLQWSNDEYRALWTQVSARAPHSFTATHRAWNYWRPRWFGSLELMEQFVEDAIAAAPLGSNLTMCRIQMLHDEFRPDGDAERNAFHRSDRMNRALDAGIADAAASDPTHIKLPYLRHWLAYELWMADRDPEAVQQFRAIDGYCDAEPWTRFANPIKKFTEVRADSILLSEDRGLPQR